MKCLGGFQYTNNSYNAIGLSSSCGNIYILILRFPYQLLPAFLGLKFIFVIGKKKKLGSYEQSYEPILS